MSMYNMLFGMNPLAGALLSILQLTPTDCGRFRDCYVDDQGRIAIYTRNGGGNRQDHAEIIAALRRHPQFDADADDDFDSTYATFWFKAPEYYIPLLDALRASTPPPAERWRTLLADLHSGANTPESQVVIENLRPLIKRITAALTPPEDKQ